MRGGPRGSRKGAAGDTGASTEPPSALQNVDGAIVQLRCWATSWLRPPTPSPPGGREHKRSSWALVGRRGCAARQFLTASAHPPRVRVQAACPLALELDGLGGDSPALAGEEEVVDALCVAKGQGVEGLIVVGTGGLPAFEVHGRPSPGRRCRWHGGPDQAVAGRRRASKLGGP